MSMQVECAHEILEASFDGACTDEQRMEFARIVDDHPELFESLIEESLIHSLLLWDCERTSRNLAASNSAAGRSASSFIRVIH